MNNFDKVFNIIKRRCERQAKFAEIHCFDAIAKEAGIPSSNLPLFLNHLQDIGLIKYSVADKYIYLTTLGSQKTTGETVATLKLH